MSKLDDAMDQLEQAVTRLETIGGSVGRTESKTEHRRLREITAQIAARVDNAVARIEFALRGEG